jgi:hypothetical protein
MVERGQGRGDTQDHRAQVDADQPEQEQNQ